MNNKKQKKTRATFFFILCMIMLSPGLVLFGQKSKQEPDAQKLIDKASYHYGKLEDYSSKKGTIDRAMLIGEEGEDVRERNKVKRKKSFIRVGGSVLMPNDSHFRKAYGDIKPVQRLALGYMISHRISIWGGFSYLNTSGTIPDTTIEVESKQAFIIFGFGYYLPVWKKIDIKAEFGFMNTKFEEDALDINISKTAGGFSFETGLQYNFSRHFFLDFSIGYMGASTMLENRQVKSGGGFSGLSLGLRI